MAQNKTDNPLESILDLFQPALAYIIVSVGFIVEAIFELPVLLSFILGSWFGKK